MKKRIFSTLSILVIALAAFAEGKAKYVFYFIGDGMGYHIRTGEHNYKVFDWNAHMDLADREFNR